MDEFSLNHRPNAQYKMKNRDGSYVDCKVVYYPLDVPDDNVALIAIKMTNGTDYREVPIRYIMPK